MRSPLDTSRKLALAGVVVSLTGGCGVVDGATSALGDITGVSAPKSQSASASGDMEPSIYCPQVLVSDGSASIRQGGTQISISNVARECLDRSDGSVLVKVGVEGLALLGPGGGSGRFSVPVTFRVMKGDSVVATRSQSVGVAIPAGQAQGSFQVVENGLVVPPRTGQFDIEVGLGGGGRRR